ncbi:hypothetical protein TMO_a0192 (plasmid) [Tistrella mobilis KA081020-065]|uniref:Uncharacterized protein n=1 Tax=Tistrella mobilis (strain KA081020-065) TaxID=1110502 RepID=I3TS57_TISMK|nr:hypothetical protein TMO_a0192 [Tistrella mobilis KA081020-065]
MESLTSRAPQIDATWKGAWLRPHAPAGVTAHIRQGIAPADD